MINLAGKVTLITGGSRGIGAAAARLLAKAGSNLMIGYRRNQAAADKVVLSCREMGVEVSSFRADLAQRDQALSVVESTVKQFGRLDILINNAGIWKYAAIESMTEAELCETLDINLKALFYCCTAAAGQMKEQRSGNIINISSTAGQRGEALHSHYAASKGAVISLTKSLAVELAPHNIRVNCVAPGWVETDMSRESLNGPEREKILAQIPLGRAGTPEELAGPILFLASDLSSFVTGEILNVNGGAVLCG